MTTGNLALFAYRKQRIPNQASLQAFKFPKAPVSGPSLISKASAFFMGAFRRNSVENVNSHKLFYSAQRAHFHCMLYCPCWV